MPEKIKIKMTHKEISTRHGQEAILEEEEFSKALANVEIFTGTSDGTRVTGFGALGYGNTTGALVHLRRGGAVQTFFSIFEPVRVEAAQA